MLLKTGVYPSLAAAEHIFRSLFYDLTILLPFDTQLCL